MTPPDPRYLATAIEVVTTAGAIQRARFGSALRVDKKGAIDLVTEVDLEVERAARALLAARFPDHDVLAEEMGGMLSVGNLPAGGCGSVLRLPG